MSGLNKNEQKDWTRLLTDPELVGHIGKLLQAYREAPPDKREEALLGAMRQLRKQAASSAPSSSASLSSDPQAVAQQATPASPVAHTATAMAAAPAIEPDAKPA